MSGKGVTKHSKSPAIAKREELSWKTRKQHLKHANQIDLLSKSETKLSQFKLESDLLMK